MLGDKEGRGGEGNLALFHMDVSIVVQSHWTTYMEEWNQVPDAIACINPVSVQGSFTWYGVAARPIR